MQTMRGIPLYGGLRVQAAAACYGIVVHHFNAILLTIQNRIYASSSALERVMLEAFINGEWIRSCATDDEINILYEEGRYPSPKINKRIKAIEEMGEWNGELEKYYKDN
ncbi:hypothetical protein AAW31_05115 [Nitrosomonas communis]|nr:hypothetical protein AAW31_05115 [Nitrosomonas communis]